jgi:hypothetical protein
LALQPAPAATRSCLQHYFDVHRRHSEASVVCVSVSTAHRSSR